MRVQAAALIPVGTGIVALNDTVPPEYALLDEHPDISDPDEDEDGAMPSPRMLQPAMHPACIGTMRCSDDAEGACAGAQRATWHGERALQLSGVESVCVCVYVVCVVFPYSHDSISLS